MKKGGCLIRFWNKTKSYILLAVMFAAIFGIGYCVFALTGTLKKEKTVTETPVTDGRVEKMVTELGLSEKDAAVFSPVYEKYLDEITPLREREREALQELTDARAGVSVETSMIEDLTEDYLDAQKREEEVMRKYMPLFSKVLPAGRDAKFGMLEEQNHLMATEVEYRME